VGPNECFKYNGHAIVKAGLCGMNTLKGERFGREVIHFKDGGFVIASEPYM
jgi:hypothetical protein